MVDDPSIQSGIVTKSSKPLPVADSLESARKGDLVYLDRHGKPLTRRSGRRREAVALAVAGGVALAVPWMYYLLFGVVGAAIGSGLTAFVGWSLYSLAQQRTGLRYMLDKRYDKAHAIFSRLAAAPGPARGYALGNLATLARRAGDLNRALAHYNDLQKWLGKRKRRDLIYYLCHYGKALTLTELGRVDDARAIVTTVVPRPKDGQYFWVMFWITELNLFMAQGSHDLPPEELHERVRVALRITTAAALIALLAWAHFHIDDFDQAEHLFAQAWERREDAEFADLPRLHEWILGEGRELFATEF